MDFSKSTFVEIGLSVSRWNTAGIETVRAADMMKILELADGNQLITANTIQLLQIQIKRLQEPVLTLAGCGPDPVKQMEQLLAEPVVDKDKVSALFTKLYTAFTDQVRRQENLRAVVRGMAPSLQEIRYQTSQLADKIDVAVTDDRQATLPIDPT